MTNKKKTGAHDNGRKKPKAARGKPKAKKKYRKPELAKHGVLSIVEGD